MAPEMAKPIRGMVFILSLRVHRGVWPGGTSRASHSFPSFPKIEDFPSFSRKFGNLPRILLHFKQWKVVFPTIQLLLAPKNLVFFWALSAWAGQVLWRRILSTKMTGKRIPSCLPYISLDLSEFISSYIIHIRISMVTSCKCSAWNDLVSCFSDFSVLTIVDSFHLFLGMLYSIACVILPNDLSNDTRWWLEVEIHRKLKVSLTMLKFKSVVRSEQEETPLPWLGLMQQWVIKSRLLAMTCWCTAGTILMFERVFVALSPNFESISLVSCN